MNTQSRPGALLSQLRNMMQGMSVATLSCIYEHGNLFSTRISRWQMDDCGSLWFSTDPLRLPAVHLPSINLSFADAGRMRHVSLSGRVAIYPEDLSSEHLLDSSGPEHNNSPRFIAQAPPRNQALLKFTPQSAVYWHTQPSRRVRLLALVSRVFGATAPSVEPGILCIEFPPGWKLDVQELSK